MSANNRKKGDTSLRIRNHILSLVEKGRYGVGDKLPGGRELADELGVSLLSVQNELSSLSSSGIVQQERGSGTYVNANWNERLLKYTVLTNYQRFQWYGEFIDLAGAVSNELYFTGSFTRGVIEIGNVLSAQRNLSDFRDLAPFLDFLPPEERGRLLGMAKQFTRDGRVLGLPLTISPRLMFYNRSVLRRAGLPEPREGWTWDDFLDALDRLPADMPGADRFDFSVNLNLFGNVLLRSGGAVFAPESPEFPVRLDYPDSLRAMVLWRDLRRKLGIRPDAPTDLHRFRRRFAEGAAAFFIGNRVNLEYFHEMAFDDFGVAPLPTIRKGCDDSTQAREVLRIRKECPADVTQAFVALALSAPYQRFFERHRYGFPVLSGAEEDVGDERDALFRRYLPASRPDYAAGFPGLLPLARKLIEDSFWIDDGFEERVGEIADLLRRMIRLGVAEWDEGALAPTR